jgi:Spermine/spermidine synthase domain
MKKSVKDAIYNWGPLFLISCLSLYMELAVIRWIAGEIRVLSYFKNLVLLAAFLGLAIGFALVGKKINLTSTFHWFWLLFVFIVLLIGKSTIQREIVYPGGGDENLWVASSFSFWFELFIFIALIIVFFFLILFLFIPLGQATGEEMAKHLPVPAYIINILASLVGIWLFSLFSYFNTPPVVWFMFSLIGLVVYFAFYRKWRWQIGIIFVISLIAIGISDPKTIWSPYNRLDLSVEEFAQGAKKIKWGYQLTVQHIFYQMGVDLSEPFIMKTISTFPELEGVIDTYAEGYNIPYTLIPPGSNILVVGSGMGNDVAAALRANMGKVVAVEIDPVILQLGQKYHPERPYDDPRVKVVVDDARSYFNRNQDVYDMVVFGLLDSHTLLSSLSSVRLDSFVYTIESFQQAKANINREGYIVVTFATNDWIEERLGKMLTKVFAPGKVYFRKWTGGTTFIASDSLNNSVASHEFSVWEPNPDFSYLPLATDDWPYIYLRTTRIPAGYWQTLIVIVLLCFGLMRRSFPDALKPDWHFWLLGAAFLLIEFKSITELALIFGTTWFVNSLAISGVLIMALLANLYVLRTKTVNLRIAYSLLIASLLLGYFFPLGQLSGFSSVFKALIGITVLSLPLYFAGIIFSESLRRYGETSRPIASNFSGSAVGGILEYGSIWWGIKSLYLIAIILYFGALLTALKQHLLKK